MTTTNTTTIDTPNGFASFVRPGMREEAVQIAEKIREITEQIRNDIERAHKLCAESEAYVKAADESARAAGITEVHPIDGALDFVAALTGGAELHAALAELMELADPD